MTATTLSALVFLFAAPPEGDPGPGADTPPATDAGPPAADTPPSEPAPEAAEPKAEPKPAAKRKKRKKKKKAAAKAEASGTGAAGDTSASGSAEVASGRRFSAPRDQPNRDKWIYRWAPVNMMGEIGVFGGVWFPHKRLELFEPQAVLPNGGHQSLQVVAPEVGLRGGFYPLRFVGIEGEGAVMPTRTRDTDQRATAWTLRAHVVGQLGLWSVTPFILAGVGVLGIAGDTPPASTGNEQDISLHFGGGVKVFINRWVQLRLDVRENFSNRLGVAEGLAGSPEILLGVTITLGRKRKRKPRPGQGDRDGDRIKDKDDFCPDVFGNPPRGCPQVCLDDNDADGLTNPEDKCPEDPETRNGFEDDDGCPDEVPPELEDLAGIMEGIRFDTDKDTIKTDSRPTLDNAIDVMNKYPTLRVRIVGHTDAQGGYRHNIDLSKRRARSVKRYMKDKGIDGKRLDTEGVGPDQPIDTNDTAPGRAKNRRIEFIILEQ